MGKVSREAIEKLAKDLEVHLENGVKGGYVREVGQTKYITPRQMYQRLYMRKIRALKDFK